MKKLIFMVVFISQFGFGQETEFTFDYQKGMTDYIVGTVENKTADEIYKKVIDWIKVTYKNPDKVILSTIDKEYVRFEGMSSSFYSIHAPIIGKMYQDTKYQIEISVKDGKYKFDIIGMENYLAPSQYNSGGWNSNGLFNANLTPDQLKGVYKKDGKLRATFKHIQDVPSYFNNLNKTLLEYISAESPAKGDW